MDDLLASARDPLRQDGRDPGSWPVRYPKRRAARPRRGPARQLCSSAR